MQLLTTDLSLSQGNKQILQNISLSVAAGEVLAVLGASGSGKTTLVESIAGLRRTSSGNVYLNSEQLRSAKMRNSLGVVFESPNFFSHLRMYRNLTLTQARKNKNDTGKDAINRICETLRISHLLSALPGDLNPWQSMLMQLARALLNAPLALVLDSPFEQIPAGNHNALRILLAEEAAKGKAILLTTNLPHQAQLVADKISLLDQGIILQTDTSSEFALHPNNLFVANVFFDQGFGIIPGTITKRLKTAFDCTLLESIDTRIPCRFEQILDFDQREFLLGVHASQISFNKPDNPDSAVCIQARLISSKQVGNSYVSLWRLPKNTVLEARTMLAAPDSGVSNLWIIIKGSILFDEHGKTLTTL